MVSKLLPGVLCQILADVVHVTDDGMSQFRLKSDILRLGRFLAPAAGGTTAVALPAVDKIA